MHFYFKFKSSDTVVWTWTLYYAIYVESFRAGRFLEQVKQIKLYKMNYQFSVYRVYRFI